MNNIVILIFLKILFTDWGCWVVVVVLAVVVVVVVVGRIDNKRGCRGWKC